MGHLGERVTDYLLDEMTEQERTEADAHIRQCPQCATQVEGFRNLYFRLQAVPAAEPPRRVVFETPKKAAPSRVWMWLSPAVSAVAASILTVMFLAPPSSAPQWLAAELDKRDSEIQRLQTSLELLDKEQHNVKRDALDAAVSIQLLAQKLP